MSVYIEDGINKMTKRSIESRLNHLPGAEMERFISKAQAMVHLKEALGSQAGLLGGLDINPLPASYEIVFKDVKNYQIDPKKLKESLEKLGGVEEVQYTEQWVERFEGLIYILKLVGLIIGGFLCIAVLFITTNTIKLNIYSRRDEIEIYKLVGATDWFVKIPFLIEGAIQGILSGLFSLLVLFFVYSFFSAKTVHFFQLPTLGIIFLPNEYSVFLISLSLILGLSGAFIAIGRFFKL
jgi:cell division transport system permease protein